MFYRAWGLTAHHGWAGLALDRRGLEEAPNTHRTKANTPVRDQILHELRARLPVRLGSANAKYQMAPACQLLNPVQQEARGLRQKEEDKREEGIARLAPGTPSPNR